MQVAGRICIVTGAGSGIGRAIAHALRDQGAEIIVSDINEAASNQVAAEVGGLSVPCDVTDPKAITGLFENARDWKGRVDLVCSNAGFAKGEPEGPTSASDDHWQQSFDVHVMAHLRLSRLALPEMLERGEGCLVNVASAAGLLSQIGDAAYSATKYAAVSLAQSLAIEHGAQGIHVSVVCPQYVATPLLGYNDAADGDQSTRILSPRNVADCLIEGLQNDRFLILPHPEVHDYALKRATDMERWIKGMQKLKAKVDASGSSDLKDFHKLL